MKLTHIFFIAGISLLVISGCSERSSNDSSVFTLYSTNAPREQGRYGVATFDLADESINEMSCREAIDLYFADFEKRKRENGWGVDVKMSYWCEKGRFRK
jgi:hypothetical protein